MNAIPTLGRPGARSRDIIINIDVPLVAAGSLIQYILHSFIFLKFVEALSPDQLVHELLNFNCVGLVLNDLRELNPVNFVAHAFHNLGD